MLGGGHLQIWLLYEECVLYSVYSIIHHNISEIISYGIYSYLHLVCNPKYVAYTQKPPTSQASSRLSRSFVWLKGFFPTGGGEIVMMFILGEAQETMFQVDFPGQWLTVGEMVSL